MKKVIEYELPFYSADIWNADNYKRVVDQYKDFIDENAFAIAAPAIQYGNGGLGAYCKEKYREQYYKVLELTEYNWGDTEIITSYCVSFTCKQRHCTEEASSKASQWKLDRGIEFHMNDAHLVVNHNKGFVENNQYSWMVPAIQKNEETFLVGFENLVKELKYDFHSALQIVLYTLSHNGEEVTDEELQTYEWAGNTILTHIEKSEARYYQELKKYPPATHWWDVIQTEKDDIFSQGWLRR